MSTPRTPGPETDGAPGAPRPAPETDPREPGEGPLADPAHRAARWFMILAPVALGIVVFLLLRLSTG